MTSPPAKTVFGTRTDGSVAIGGTLLAKNVILEVRVVDSADGKPMVCPEWAKVEWSLDPAYMAMTRYTHGVVYQNHSQLVHMDYGTVLTVKGYTFWNDGFLLQRVYHHSYPMPARHEPRHSQRILFTAEVDCNDNNNVKDDVQHCMVSNARFHLYA